jgi:hypothetical protein
VTDLFHSKTGATSGAEPVNKAPGTRQKPPHGHYSGMEHSSVSHIVRERLAALGLAQIPPGALEILSRKLAGHLRNLAAKSITPRAVARAVLFSAQSNTAKTDGNLKGGLLNGT